MESKSRAKQGFEHIRNSGVRETLAEYLRERLLEKQKALMHCSKDTFEVHKGRCLELQELLQDLIK